MALQTDGKIVLVGRFTTVGGVSRALVARVDSAGVVDSFDPPGGPVIFCQECPASHTLLPSRCRLMARCCSAATSRRWAA